ncbi:carboxyl transferase domain-containing protein [Phytohabitans sp. ZYX-F-186]|uniref:Acetyl-coenzyme A carboxylase carboxyl transferase subunits beta/alpha n=1 Tax=Phytohabitans maris TaxID=3071409 RepID=A0ABU0ZPA8_9ACTN|nr:carboxyl transferase domain-containing protein [Phytohabitans sp. ZYX-F-186]MDQ7908556.1 carboxyl transferase domain-containing protein [Phytohabitans sp. ZYX-F-186]
MGPRLIHEWDAELRSADPLRFPGYGPPAAADESVRTGLAAFGDRRAVLVECRFDHQGGTMGAVAGERLVRALRRAVELRLPVVELVASGGARLQEGMVSLVQMARTASAARAHAASGLMSVAVYRSPTTGGVYASWASLVDLRAAEPGAVVGFGGPRVVAEVTGHWPPATSHTAESAYRAGLVDAVVPAEEQFAWVRGALGGPAPPLLPPPGRPVTPDPSNVPAEPWWILARARHRSRPSGVEWAAWLCDSWVELHGADPAVRAGLARVGGERVVVVAMDRHAGGDGAARPRPAGYRLAQRAVRLADRIGCPVLTLIDTPGAEPGPTAESDGVAQEIAGTLVAMAACRTPTVALCVGEGGSGGAMALGHADRLLMLDGAAFSVIGPEAASAILYRDSSHARQLAADLRITAADLSTLGLVDGVVPESGPGTVATVRAAVLDALATARIGDRDRRTATATARALAGP